MAELKTTNIHGKEYVEVNERIKAFRTQPQFFGWSLTSEIIDLTPESITIRAKVTNAAGVVIAEGLAREDKNASNINRTSYVENCETSAWGRALGNLGIGVDSSICSAQELLVALASDNSTKTAEKPKATAARQITKPAEKVAQNEEKQCEPQPIAKVASLTAAQLKLQKSVVDYLNEHTDEISYYKNLVGKERSADWVYADYMKVQNEINRIAQEKLKQGHDQNQTL